MKTVAFHSNQLGIRGTEVALYDYALYNESLLQNKSYIISDAKSELQTLKKFQDKFEVFLYNNFSEVEHFVSDKNIDYVYFIKAGDVDGKLVSGAKNLVHAVFQHKQPHGDRYAYVSKWLAEKMNMPESYVPHIVWLPEPTKHYKKELNIPEENIVVGRHGGSNAFDLPFVHSAVYKTAQQRKDITFLFMNTEQFCPKLPNIIHINGTYNLQNKSNFINTCDYMLHARGHGESFGLAISEFLFLDKPVISWQGGLDGNHITMLGEEGIWYKDQQDCFNILMQLGKLIYAKNKYKKLVENFLPKNVMSQFDRVFLS